MKRHMPKDQLKKGIAATARGSAIRSDGTLSPPTSNANLPMDDSSQKKDVPMQAQAAALLKSFINYMSSMKMLVLVILCLQNSLFTVLRRYSQGVLREVYSKHEVLLVGEVIKMAFSAWMISKDLPADCPSLKERLRYLVETSKKMFMLACIYGAMNILSFVALRNIGAGLFTVFAQCKIMTTATFSAILLRRSYSWARWRALFSLMCGVLLFSEPIWGDPSKFESKGGNVILGTVAVLTEVSLSGFASIYFEKVIKTDALQLGIWERNFQLALGSFPIYVLFILSEMGGEVGIFGGWSWIAFFLSLLGAAGGLLVALSIKYGDSILKTLATTGSIILSAYLDHTLLGGPLTAVMCIAGVQVIIAICNYTFDATPVETRPPADPKHASHKFNDMVDKSTAGDEQNDEEVALVASQQQPQTSK